MMVRIFGHTINIKNHKYGLLRCSFVIIPVPLIDKSQQLMVYKIHNLPILMPPLLKQFKYNLPNVFITISKDNLYITYPNSNEIFSCQLSVGYYCEINTPFYLVTNQTTDQVVSLHYYYWAITTMVPTKLQVICLTSFYYIKLKCPVDIIFLPNACEACTDTFYLPARNSLSKEIYSRKNGSRLTNLTLEYKDTYYFALVKGLQIPNLTTDELTKLATETPKMQEVTIHSLNTKLREINRNHPWLMPDWLKIVLMILLPS